MGGRKPILITCVSGSVIGICLFALTVSLDWDNYLPLWASTVPLSLLFLARIIDGISGGTAATATTILADISTPENRAKTFGLIGVAFGLGFILGPGLGTALAKFSVTLPVWVASGFAIFNLIFVILFLPETLPKNNRNLLPRKRDLNPISQLLIVFKNPLARRLCLSFFTFFMAFNGFTAVLVLYLKEEFGWSPELCSALKLGVTNPVPIASIATPENTRGIDVSIFASVKRIHPVITKPIPVKVNLDSPNLFTRGAIRTP